MKFGYKVLRSRKRSAILDKSEGGIQYSKEETITPNKGCGPLCVFETVEDAQAFAYVYVYEKKWEIWEVKYKPSRKQRIFNKQDTYALKDLPWGTRLADSVQLLTCIERA